MAQDGTFHRFTPPLPRLVVGSSVCDTCGNEVATHEGPAAGRHYDYPLREVAAAFVAVGTGASYLRAADRARASAGRRQLDGDRGGALVAEWLDLFGRHVLGAYAETTWPQTLVLDSTRFMVDNRRTGTQRLAFNVLGAYGYPDPGAGGPRVWALRASHRARQQDWVELLTSLDVTTPPRLVVTDGADEIGNAVRAVWPALPGPSFPQPYLLSCEHHLHRNGVEAMGRDGIGGPGHPMRLLLDTALRSSSGWAELCAKAVGFRATERWLAGIYTPVRQQVAVRHLLPAHHSTAALDTALGRVRDFLDARSFALRNARRTNLLLGLVRLHLNGADVERHYHALIRDFTDTARGRPGQQRTGYETRPLPGPTGDRRNAPGSLRS